GAMGRALPGVALRTGEDGRLEALAPGLGDDWIRTTDLAEIDADGFVFHRGRADGAIVRGGFKILPESLAEVLHRHPAVREAAVVGADDPRLGQVPVAAVELRAGAAEPSEE